MSESTMSLTMNFKKAFSVAAAAGLAFSMPGQAQSLLGGDAVTLTGVFDTVVERTRSCSISTISEGSAENGLNLYGTRGDTIRLTRRAGSSNATGKVGVAFDASGANAVYFEEFQVGKLDDDRTEIVDPEEGEGSMVMALANPVISPKKNSQSGESILDQIQDNADNTITGLTRNEKVTVNKDGSNVALMLGGQTGKKAKANATLAEMDKDYSLPAVRRATITMTIENVATVGTSAIRARLVCQPLALEPPVPGRITPVPDSE